MANTNMPHDQTANAGLKMSNDQIARTCACFIAKYRKTPQDGVSPFFILKCEEVLVDPVNRDGNFCMFENITKKAEEHSQAGFVPGLTDNICIEFSDDVADTIIQFNDDAQKMDNRLPCVIKGVAAYSAASGNHTNIFQRMVSQAVTCDSYCSVDGKMSLERLGSICNVHAKTVVEGMPWTKLDKAIRSQEPKAISIIQAAKNLEGASRSQRSGPRP